MESQQEKRPRGRGSTFLNGSQTWWIAYSDRGIKHRESSGSTDRKVAEKLLDRRLAELLTNTYTPRTNIRVDELVEDLTAEYREKQQGIDAVEYRWRLHLKPFFTKRRAADVTTDMIRRYIAGRVEQSAEPATINRELAVLKRAFNLALESTPPKVRIVPHIPMFEEKNVRKGFLQDAEYGRLAAECGKLGLWLRAILAVGYNFGWRAGEVLELRVNQIDLADRTIRLEVGETKNGCESTVTMTNEVFELIKACVVGKKPDEPVFTHADGTPVLDFRNAWHGVCVRAGVSGQNGVSRFVCSNCEKTMTKMKCKCGSRKRRYDGLLFHDLRRTGVRNLRRLGVAESVAMKISGHKTASVFRRYDIIEQADLADAARRLDVKRKSDALPEFSFGQSSDRVNENGTKTSATTAQSLTAVVLPN